MSEMALTADHLVVIGRGMLIAEMPVTECIAQSSLHYVRVRTGETEQLFNTLGVCGRSINYR
jgi:ABC-2 type transport system ATP-binding protein